MRSSVARLRAFLRPVAVYDPVDGATTPVAAGGNDNRETTTMPMYWQLKRWKTDDRQRAIDRITALRKLVARTVPRRTASDTLWRTWQMSDHLPLFIELRIDFNDKYLKRIREGQQPVNPPTPDATDD
jgi:hypothetical protein